MRSEENEEILLKRAREEERLYNWKEATNLYKQAVNLYLKSNS